MTRRIEKKRYMLEVDKNAILEKEIEYLSKGIKSYYTCDYSENISLPEGVTDDDILYTLRDEKQGLIAILLK